MLTGTLVTSGLNRRRNKSISISFICQHQWISKRARAKSKSIGNFGEMRHSWIKQLSISLKCWTKVNSVQHFNLFRLLAKMIYFSKVCMMHWIGFNFSAPALAANIRYPSNGNQVSQVEALQRWCGASFSVSNQPWLIRPHQRILNLHCSWIISPHTIAK